MLKEEFPSVLEKSNRPQNVRGQSTHIPIKILSAGVIPIIFAMSIIAFPGTLAGFFGKNAQSGGFVGKLLTVLSPASAFYAILYFLLIIFFTYFYTAIQFNPIEIANNMKKNGGFIPGLRPGKAHKRFYNKGAFKNYNSGRDFLGIIAVFRLLWQAGRN